MSKTISITGAGSEFGEVAALELARRGHEVIASAILPHKRPHY